MKDSKNACSGEACSELVFLPTKNMINLETYLENAKLVSLVDLESYNQWPFNTIDQDSRRL